MFRGVGFVGCLVGCGMRNVLADTALEQCPPVYSFPHRNRPAKMHDKTYTIVPTQGAVFRSP